MVAVKIQKEGSDGPLARCIARMAEGQHMATVVKKEEVGASIAAASAASSGHDANESTTSGTSNSAASLKEDDYEDPSPAGAWVKEWIQQDKKDYNAFYYRVSKSDACDKS